MNSLGTMFLRGEDVRDFLDSVFRPTEEEIMRHKEMMHNINEDITITPCDNGFTAEIKSLVL